MHHFTLTFNILALFGAVLSTQARNIDWGSSIGVEHVQQDLSTPLDSAFVFYLGVFESGFYPSSGNMGEWAENWITLDAVNYNTTHSGFGARHKITSSDPAPGTQGYIWGVRRVAEGCEWVLITDPSWIWPVDDLLAFKVTWTVSSASQAIVGSINTVSHEIVSEDATGLPIPDISYDIWRLRHFSDAEVLAGGADPMADSNNDGQPNIVDFALDNDPRSNAAKRPASGVFDVSAMNFINKSGIPQDLTRYLGVIVEPSLDANINFTGIISDAPDFSVTTEAVVEPLADGSLFIRDTEPVGGGNTARYLSVQFTIAE